MSGEEGELSAEINGNEDTTAKAPTEAVQTESDAPLTPHPFYDYCSEAVKRFIVAEILPLARKYAVEYHSQGVSEESKETFKHAYAAREQLQACLGLTSAILERTEQTEWDQNCVERDRSCLKMLVNFLLYQIGKINNEVEEPHNSEPLLLRSFESLKHLSSSDQLISLYCCVCNELGLIWCQRGEHDKSMEYLTCGKNAHEEYQQATAPLHVNELFCPGAAMQSEEARDMAWQRTYTHCLYYLAQVYGHLGEYDKASLFCRRTLVRQLSNIATPIDAVEWSFNAATLSNYYSTHKRFAVARHCIACAQAMFQSHLAKANVEELSESKRERIERNKADIARFWIRLSRMILHESSSVFQAKIDSKSLPSEDLERIKQLIEASEQMFRVAEGISPEDRFEGVDVKDLESGLVLVCSNHSEAVSVFKFAQTQISIAHGFYQLNGYVTDHIEVAQDASTLYKLLSMFEPSIELKCRMHKRRIDMLEEPASLLSTQHYLMLCRQMWYEIADTYMEMAGLKSDNLKCHITQAPIKTKQKYNKLNMQSHKYYKKFHDTIKPEKSGVYGIEIIRPLVLSKMGMSKSNTNLLVGEREQFRYMNEALVEYKWIVKYLDEHPEARDRCRQQYELVKELSTLLPAQIDKYQKLLKC